MIFCYCPYVKNIRAFDIVAACKVQDLAGKFCAEERKKKFENSCRFYSIFIFSVIDKVKMELKPMFILGFVLNPAKAIISLAISTIIYYSIKNHTKVSFDTVKMIVSCIMFFVPI